MNLLSKLIYKLSRKRKQCCECGKTFYKPHKIDVGYDYFYMTPCCKYYDWVEV